MNLKIISSYIKQNFFTFLHIERGKVFKLRCNQPQDYCLPENEDFYLGTFDHNKMIKLICRSHFLILKPYNLKYFVYPFFFCRGNKKAAMKFNMVIKRVWAT